MHAQSSATCLQNRLRLQAHAMLSSGSCATPADKHAHPSVLARAACACASNCPSQSVTVRLLECPAFGAVPQAKQTVRKLETVLDWEHNRQTIESGLESTQGLLLALCGIAARTRHMWKPLAALIGIAACSALVGWLSGRAAFVQAAAVAVILAASAAVAAGVVHWRLAAGLERLELDMGMLKTHAQQAGALAAELQSLALRRSQQLVTAMQDELRNTHWQAQHALVCVLLRERAGGAQAQAAAAGP